MPVTPGPSAANGIERTNFGLAQQATNNLQAVNPGVDPTRPKFEQQNFLDTLRQELEKAQEEASQGIESVDQEELDVNGLDGDPVMASYFSLAKVAQFQADPMMAEDTADLSMTDPTTDPIADPSMGQPQSDLQSQFNSPQELQALLDQNADNPDFVNEIVQSAPTDSQSLVRDAVQRYYEPERDPADKTIIAAEVFKAIHGRGQGEETVDATYTQASAENAVNETLKIIEAFAKKAALTQKLNKKASYNLKKEAQYGVNRNGGSEFINFGPESKRVFPHSNTGLLGSEWHNWIRGRDHNFIFDDRAFDFEVFWRGNIMDKYSQPYRNDKGEWVGGYINKRFDVDRNIPEGNNLQLLPGQRRRPYLPEFATIEARMEASRKKMAEDRGYEPTDTEAKPYNWKEASVKKKVIAQSLPKIPSLPPIDKVKPLALEKVCPACSSDNTPTAVLCANCGADIAKIRAIPKQRKRDQEGEQKGQNSHETLMSGVPINKVHVPGFTPKAQSMVPRTTNQQVKPIKPNRKRISDDDVQVVDETHLSNVEQSANSLGL